MSNNLPGPEFWTRADAVVNLANDQCEAAPPSEVGASTLFAASRFNAFLLAKSTGSAANMATEKEQALNYFTEQFRTMMSSNIDDFMANFDSYMRPDTK